jgi:hypothetical protein
VPQNEEHEGCAKLLFIALASLSCLASPLHCSWAVLMFWLGAWWVRR